MSRQTEKKALVVKFGGSAAVNEHGIDVDYFHSFFDQLQNDILATFAHAAFVIGGGDRAREVQQKFVKNTDKDEAGIRITQEHAVQLNEVLRSRGISVADTIPKSEKEMKTAITEITTFALALGGMKAGQSTDAVTIAAAELFQESLGEALVVILSNVAKIFTSDPKTHPAAKGIRRAQIGQLIRDGVLFDDQRNWEPGLKSPIDPIAVRKLSRKKGGSFIPVFFGHARDTDNIRRFLLGKKTTDGTTLVADGPTQYSRRLSKRSQ